MKDSNLRRISPIFLVGLLVLVVSLACQVPFISYGPRQVTQVEATVSAPTPIVAVVQAPLPAVATSEEEALRLQDAVARANTLSALLPHLPPPERARALAAALAEITPTISERGPSSTSTSGILTSPAKIEPPISRSDISSVRTSGNLSIRPLTLTYLLNEKEDN